MNKPSRNYRHKRSILKYNKTRGPRLAGSIEVVYKSNLKTLKLLFFAPGNRGKEKTEIVDELEQEIIKFLESKDFQFRKGSKSSPTHWINLK